MLGIKLGVVVAMLGAAVAVTPNDYLCHTAPAVTTTVFVTECGQPSTPAVSPAESQVQSTALPLVETSPLFLPSSTPTPASSSSARPESSVQAPPASSSGTSGSEPWGHEPTSTAAETPSQSSPSPTSEPEQPTSNAASSPGVPLNLGSVVVVGMAINAAMAALG